MEYSYSKCTAISSARDYDTKDVDDERTDLQHLLRYIDNRDDQSLDTAVDVVQTDSEDRENVVENTLQVDPANTVEDDLRVEKVDETAGERTENDLHDLSLIHI